MALAARLAITAQRLIAVHGRPAILQGRTSAPIDPDRPWRARGEIVLTLPITAVFTVTDRSRELGQLNGRRMQTALIAFNDVGVNTALGDYHQIVDGLTTLEIIEVGLLRPGPDGVLYNIQVAQ